MATRSRWHEYRVSASGELALNFTNTMIPLAFGLGAGLLLTFAIGLPAEQGFMAAFLTDLGMEAETIWDTVTALDRLSRIGLAVLMCVGLLVALGGSIASYIADSATSKSLASAAQSDAPRHLVPAPHQVERVTREDSGLEIFLLMVSLISGIIMVPLFFFSLSEDFGEGAIVSLAGIAVIAGMLYAYRHIKNVGKPAQHSRRMDIAEHWTTEDEAAAWDAAQQIGEEYYKDRGKKDRHHFIRLGSLLDMVGAACLALAPIIFYAMTFVLYPDARETSPGQWDLGRRATLDESTEEMAYIGMWALVIFLLLAIILPSVGLLLQGLGEKAERAGLMRALDDTFPSKPAHGILVHHSDQHASPLGRFVAGAAGIAIAFGPAALILSTMGDGGFYSGMGDAFTPFRPLALAITVCAVILLIAGFLINAQSNTRSIELRNRLMERWPTLPRPKTTGSDDDRDFIPATVGPALTP
ncbi:MAG: hypothetical protein ACTHW1_08860 [Ancrocorticia sp.]|uniref:hypothetical protein n=1 Tax=Ancrocorticia sp. TaxID=2593684 RepID=UPI003F933223